MISADSSNICRYEIICRYACYLQITDLSADNCQYLQIISAGKYKQDLLVHQCVRILPIESADKDSYLQIICLSADTCILSADIADMPIGR